MKKLFTFLFLISAVCPLIAAEFYDNVISNKEIGNMLNKNIQAEVVDSKDAESDENLGANSGLVNVILFHQEIYTEGGREVTHPKKDCVSVVIDDAWVIASKKCLLTKGDNISPLPGRVESSYISRFRVVLNGKTYKVAEKNQLTTKNFFLLKVTNENGNPVFSVSPKANLAFASSSDKAKFDKEFAGGTFEINRTDKHNSIHDDGHHAVWEDNFSAYYGVGRESYEKEIEALTQEGDNIIATVSSTWVYPKLLRAGDPLFFIKEGKRYLLGFGNAVNLWDNFDKTRSDKVILLTKSDKEEIIKKIKSVDSKAAARIEKNSLVK